MVVLQVSASDADTGINSSLSYDFSSGNVEEKFVMDAKTGVISVATIDGLSSYYLLEVSVTDGRFTTLAQVEIQLERIVASGLAFAKEKYTGSVVENTSRTDTVATLNLLGTLLNEHVTFTILNGDPAGIFQVGATSGVLRTDGYTFDREAKDFYVIVVEARSERGDGEKPRIAHTRIQVNVTDMNDNRPVFYNLPYYAVVSKEAPKGTLVTKVCFFSFF